MLRTKVESPSQLFDTLASLYPDSSRTTLRQLLASGRVRINGKVEKIARRPLKAGDVVDVGSKGAQHDLPTDLSILYEDDDLLVVLKEAGLLSVASIGEKEKTAQAYLNAYLKSKGRRERIHVVHRLDRDTSGLLVFAKSFEIREALKEKFAAHDIDRVYVAIVEGSVEQPAGTFRSHLREDRTFRVSTVDDPNRGKLAITHYRRLGSGKRYSMLEITLETGRKNQIRVHLSEAGHPVVGDERYGAKTNPLHRLGLHARLLGFEHPTRGKRMKFEAPLPDVFRELQL